MDYQFQNFVCPLNMSTQQGQFIQFNNNPSQSNESSQIRVHDYCQNNLYYDEQEIEVQVQLNSESYQYRQKSSSKNFNKQKINQILLKKNITDQLGDFISSGGEASLYHIVSDSNEQSQDYLFRVIQSSSQKEFEKAKMEFEVVNLFKNSINIIKYKNIILLEEDLIIIFVVQKCSTGSLQKQLKDYSLFKDNFINIKESLKVSFAIINFLIELRIHKVFHGDIKPQNILRDQNNYILIDFGASKIISNINSKGEIFKYSPDYFPDDHTNMNYYQIDTYCAGRTLLRVFQQCQTGKNTKLKGNIINFINDFLQKKETDCLDIIIEFTDLIICAKGIKLIKEHYLELIDLILYKMVFDNNKDTLFQYKSLKIYLSHQYQILFLSNKKNEIIERFQQLKYILKQLESIQDKIIKDKIQYLILKRMKKIHHLLSNTDIANRYPQINFELNQILKRFEDFLQAKREEKESKFIYLLEKMNVSPKLQFDIRQLKLFKKLSKYKMSSFKVSLSHYKLGMLYYEYQSKLDSLKDNYYKQDNEYVYLNLVYYSLLNFEKYSELQNRFLKNNQSGEVQELISSCKLKIINFYEDLKQNQFKQIFISSLFQFTNTIP